MAEQKVTHELWKFIWPLCDFETALLGLEIELLEESDLVEQTKDAFLAGELGYGAFRIYVQKYGTRKLCKALGIQHCPPSTGVSQ